MRYHYPGRKILPLKTLSLLNNIKSYIGQYVYLRQVPLTMLICQIFNKQNIKNTYCRSWGSRAYRQKVLKKQKLITVQLPSTQLKYFSPTALCNFSPTRQFKKTNLVEGSWGQSFKKSKHIDVRGVARNPVDHPNGGRTKAKQPELSP